MKDKNKDFLLTGLNVAVLAFPILIATFFRGLNKELIDKVMVYSGAAISLAFILGVENVIALHSNKLTKKSMRYTVPLWHEKVKKGCWCVILFIAIFSLTVASAYILIFGISLGLDEEVKWKWLFEIGTYASFAVAVICNLIIIALFKKYKTSIS